MNYYRHGDLGFTPIKNLPEDLKRLYVGCRFVLAEGETTGHKHLLTSSSTTTFEILENQKGQRYLKIDGKGNISHEEHKTIEIEKGFYIVGNEREYSYFENST